MHIIVSQDVKKIDVYRVSPNPVCFKQLKRTLSSDVLD